MRKINTIWHTTLLLLVLLSTVTVSVSAISPEVIYHKSSNRCIVFPTGSDDTTNIQDAFNLVTAEGTGTVKLVAGVYTVNTEIEVINFDGKFIGAGQGKTILKTTDRDDWPHRDEPYFPEVASVFLFYQNDMKERTIKISDMTVEVHATTDPYDDFFGLNVFDIYGNVDGTINYDETPLSTILKRVIVIGDSHDDWPFTNVVNTFQVGGEPHVDDGWSFEPITGSHIVKNCIFDTVGASVKYNSVNGKVKVKNNVIKDNLVGIWLYFCDTIDAPKREIKNNVIYNSGWIGIAVWGSNSFTIKKNKIVDGEIGIEMWGSEDNLIEKNYLSGNVLDLSWDEYGDNTWKLNVYTTKDW